MENQRRSTAQNISVWKLSVSVHSLCKSINLSNRTRPNYWSLIPMHPWGNPLHFTRTAGKFEVPIILSFAVYLVTYMYVGKHNLNWFLFQLNFKNSIQSNQNSLPLLQLTIVHKYNIIYTYVYVWM